MEPHITAETLRQLLDEHASALTLFASQWTNAPEDCVQEAFVELLRQRQPPECIVAWLFRVVRNRAVTMRRATNRRERHESAAAVERTSWFAPGDDPLIDEQQLTAALQTLAEEQREVIVARVWGCLSFEQIAEVVGTSRSSAHRRYESAMQALRERLGLSCPNEIHPTKLLDSKRD